MPARLAALLFISTFLFGGCQSLGPVQDPTLVIEGNSGSELGVNTDYGILFLGRHSRAGKIGLTAWFGDGPSLESTIVEPVGGGIYTAETEIRLPSVNLTFVSPKEGETVLISGRQGRQRWVREARVVKDRRVIAGILLDVGSASELTENQVGAPVLIQLEDGKWYCVGVVSGKISLSTPTGEVEYVTVLGPENTWRLVAHRRDIDRRQRWIYREDVL